MNDSVGLGVQTTQKKGVPTILGYKAPRQIEDALAKNCHPIAATSPFVQYMRVDRPLGFWQDFWGG